MAHKWAHLRGIFVNMAFLDTVVRLWEQQYPTDRLPEAGFRFRHNEKLVELSAASDDTLFFKTDATLRYFKLDDNGATLHPLVPGTPDLVVAIDDIPAFIRGGLEIKPTST
jgi:hypothetical protein